MATTDEEAQRKRDALLAYQNLRNPQAGEPVRPQQQAQNPDLVRQQQMGSVPVRTIVQQTATPPVSREAAAQEKERIARATVGVGGSQVVADVRTYNPESLPMLKRMELYTMFGPERVG